MRHGETVEAYRLRLADYAAGAAAVFAATATSHWAARERAEEAAGRAGLKRRRKDLSPAP